MDDWHYVFQDKKKLLYLQSEQSTWLKGTNARTRTVSLGIPNLMSYMIQFQSTDVVIESEIKKKTQSLLRKADSISQFVEMIDTGKVAIDSIVAIEANVALKERFRITNPRGIKFPILSQGSYLAFRPPFSEIVLADGIYTEAYLYNLVGGQPPGCNEMVTLAFCNSESANINKLLESWDCCHARVLGIVHNVPDYIYSVSYKDADLANTQIKKTRLGIFVLAMEVKLPTLESGEDPSLRERLSMWRKWNV